MTSQKEAALKSLTPQSSLTLLLRTLYQMMMDYCVVLPSDDRNPENLIMFNKDQLVTLIERDSVDSLVADIPRMIKEGIFRPGAMPEPDIAQRDLPVLFVEEGGGVLTTLKEARSLCAPKFPVWWEAPIPFVLHKSGKLYSNSFAKALLGDDERRLSRSFPGGAKEEFLVELKNEKDNSSFVFRRLEDDVFMVEKCDAEEANDIVWWAATGRAWIVSLAEEGRVCHRFERREIETLSAEELGALNSDNFLFPCDWDGERLGYLCVENKKPQPPQKAQSASVQKEVRKATKEAQEAQKEKGRASPSKTLKRATPKKKGASLKDSKENETLRILGPQAMGLLAPGQVSGDSDKNE
ncbi:hypothetical protein AGMMS49957_04840 [Synergistales bacterium]|nr:hypothetical protein AGMMS49957_04840 [Synergistales bacterium]